MLHQGTVLNEKYRLVDKLGEGGMGTVWLAENLSIECEVAVKVLHASFTQDPTAVLRFHNEARAAASIKHPSIVQVYDFGKAEDGAPYMVMERMHGESLAERIEREGALPAREAVGVVTDVLEALDAAHAKGILHRDLKPENLFLARVGDRVVPKILDFGVSKFLGDDAERVRMTRTGTLVGTPAYMSPEQARGLDNVDLRSDIWAMGVILFEVLSGQLPFDASNYNAMLILIATTTPPSLSTLVPDIDPQLAEITACALCPDRHGRFKSARAMRDALLAWSRGEAVTLASSNSTTPPPPPARVSAVERVTPLTFEHADTLNDGKTPVFRPHRKAPPYALAGLSLALLSGLGWYATHRPQSPTAPAVARAQPLDIDYLPPGYRVFVNDQETTLPFATTAGATYRILVRAPGYQDWQHVLEARAEPARIAYRGEHAVAPLVPPPSPPAALQVANALAQPPTAPRRPIAAHAPAASPHAPHRTDARGRPISPASGMLITEGP